MARRTTKRPATVAQPKAEVLILPEEFHNTGARPQRFPLPRDDLQRYVRAGLLEESRDAGLYIYRPTAKGLETITNG